MRLDEIEGEVVPVTERMKSVAKSLLGIRLKTDQFNPDQWAGYAARWPSYSDSSYPSVFSSCLGIYRNSLAVRIVVGFRAKNFASVPLKIYRRISDSQREELENHPARQVVKDPNQEDTEFTFWRDYSSDMDIFDCTFWKKVRVGNRLFLQRLYPDAMVPDGGNNYSPEHWIMKKADGTEEKLKRTDVFWVHGYGGMKGSSAMDVLRQELEVDSAEADFRRTASRTRWRNLGVITRPKSAGKWDSKSRQNFLDSLDSRFSGDGAGVGRPLLLEEDMAWQNDSVPSAVTDYVGARTFTLKLACHALHLTPQLLGIEGAPYASLLEYKNQLYQINLAPDLTFAEQMWEKQIMPEFSETAENDYAEFNLKAKLRGDAGQQAAIAATAVGKPWKTRDEERADQNMPPLTEEQKQELDAKPGESAPPADSMQLDQSGAPTLEGTGSVGGAQPLPSDSYGGQSNGNGRVLQLADLGVIRQKAVESFIPEMERLVLKARGMNGKRSGIKGEMTGAISLAVLDVTSKIGKAAAELSDASYDASKTVAYLYKAAEQQANEILKSVDTIDPKEVAEELIAGSASWSIMELHRQQEEASVSD